VPVISVGAGASPDGIYIGCGDAVGYSAFPRPKNQRCFVDVRPLIEQGLRAYKEEVLARTYPSEEFTAHMTKEEHDKFLELVA
jgi:3-methyl-2-oxobutanoate hydroxymethyltransferase